MVISKKEFMELWYSCHNWVLHNRKGQHVMGLTQLEYKETVELLYDKLQNKIIKSEKKLEKQLNKGQTK